MQGRCGAPFLVPSLFCCLPCSDGAWPDAESSDCRSDRGRDGIPFWSQQKKDGNRLAKCRLLPSLLSYLLECEGLLNLQAWDSQASLVPRVIETVVGIVKFERIMFGHSNVAITKILTFIYRRITNRYFRSWSHNQIRQLELIPNWGIISFFIFGGGCEGEAVSVLPLLVATK